MYVIGSRVGLVESDGDIYRDGSRIGQIESDGDLYVNGSRVGQIENDGDIYRNGSRWGRAQGCCISASTYQRVAAVLLSSLVHPRPGT